MVERKKFHEIEIPLLKEKVFILGKTKQDTANKTILLDLTRKLRGKSTELTLKTSQKEEKIIAEPIQLRILPFYIRRAMRKGVSYIEDSFQVECKNAKMVIKPLLITRKKVSRKVRKALREKARENLIIQLNDLNAEQVFSNLLTNNIQKSLSLKLKKIYPLAFCDIKFVKVYKKLTNNEVKKERPDKEEKTNKNT